MIQQWTGDAWVNLFENTWTYDAEGHAIEQFTKYWKDTVWVDQMKYTFTYDPGNKGPTWQFTQTWNDTLKTWNDDTKTLWFYDENGNPITSLTQALRGGGWVNDSRMNYQYDTNGYLIGWSYDRWDGRSWAAFTRATLTLQHLVTNVGISDINLPRGNILFANYPNPFNPSTNIKFQISGVSRVKLQVHDVLGMEVATLVDEERQPGEYTVKWNTEKIPSGVYFYRLTVVDPSRGSGRGFSQTRKMILTR